MMSVRSSSLQSFRRVPSVSRSFKTRTRNVTPVVAASRSSKKKVSGFDDTGFNKNEAMEKLTAEINAEYGKGTMMKLTDQPLDVPKTTTGLMSLDIILGGGIPNGRIVEIFGPEATGKTTLAMQLLAEMQKPDNYVQFIDAENAFNPAYAVDLGIDRHRLLLTNPPSGEEALDIILKVIRARVMAGICVDSVAALTPLDEQTASMEDSQMALQARMMARGLRNITASNSQSRDLGTTIIFINQIRLKMNVGLFQNPEDRPGGKALRFYPSTVLELRRGKAITNAEGQKIGHKMIVKNPKNKIAVPHKEVVLDLIYGKGVCRTSSLVDAATMLDVVEMKGSYYSFDGARLAHGRTNLVDRLKAEPQLAEQITEATRNAYQKAIEEERANLLGQAPEEQDNEAAIKGAADEDDEDVIKDETDKDEEEKEDVGTPTHDTLNLDDSADRAAA